MAAPHPDELHGLAAAEHIARLRATDPDYSPQRDYQALADWALRKQNEDLL